MKLNKLHIISLCLKDKRHVVRQRERERAVIGGGGSRERPRKGRQMNCKKLNNNMGEDKGRKEVVQPEEVHLKRP